MKFIGMIFIVAALLTGTCRSQPKVCHGDPTNRLMMTKNQMDFTMMLFKHSSTASESHLLSPFAVISALSVLYQGARGNTQHEMTVLGGGQSAQIFDNYAHCIIDLSDIDDRGSSQENEDFIIGESAKLWVHQNVSINPNFINIMMIHGVTVEDENFSQDDDDLVEIANDWLSDNAYERANNVIFINFDSSLLLINELHLKLEWKYHFVSLNYPTYFSLSISQGINIAMMGRTAEFPYYEDQSVQVISLPLVKPGMCMIIILPKQICELAKIEMELTGEKLFNYISALEESDKSKKTMVTIPKFYARKYFILSDGLESMGLRSMFTQSANFTGISDQPLSITKHIGNLASMQIAEDGINVNYIDSSAEKSEMINNLFMPTSQTFDANHPFIYFITDKPKNILWIGRCTGDEDAIETNDELIKEYEKVMERDEITGYNDELEEFEKIIEKTAAGENNERIKSSEYGEFSGMIQPSGQREFSGMTQSSEYGEFSGMTGHQEQGEFSGMTQSSEYGEFSGMIQPSGQREFSGMTQSSEYGEFSGMTGHQEQGEFSSMTQSSEYGEFSGMTGHQEQEEFSGMTQSLEYGKFSGMIHLSGQGEFSGMTRRQEQGEFSGMTQSSEYGEFSGMIQPSGQGEFSGMTQSSEYGEFSGMTGHQEQGEFSGMTQSSEYGEFSGMIQPPRQGQYVEVMQPPEQGEYIEYPEEDEFANTDSQNHIEIDFQNM